MMEPQLFEIRALVSYSVVILAVSKEDALAHVSTWENCWPTSSDLNEVSDVEVTDVRKSVAEHWIDEAHEITAAASIARRENDGTD